MLTSSREDVNSNFDSYWFNRIGNQKQAYSFNSRALSTPSRIEYNPWDDYLHVESTDAVSSLGSTSLSTSSSDLESDPPTDRNSPSGIRTDALIPYSPFFIAEGRLPLVLRLCNSDAILKINCYNHTIQNHLNCKLKHSKMFIFFHENLPFWLSTMI